MTEKLIKRFLLEKYYESGEGKEIPAFGEIYTINDLYEKMSNFDEKEFFVWLDRLKRNNKNFGNTIQDLGFLSEEQKHYEITDDISISTIKNLVENPEFILSQSGEGCFEKPYNKQINGQLVICGIYDNQLIYLSNLLRNTNSSFIVGYYGQKDSEYTKRVIEYYKQLRKFLPLLIGDRQVDLFEDTILDSAKIITLSYKPSSKGEIIIPKKARTR